MPATNAVSIGNFHIFLSFRPRQLSNSENDKPRACSEAGVSSYRPDRRSAAQSRVLNPCPSVSIDIPNANGANVSVDMRCVAADPYRFWFNPPVRSSNNSTGAMTKRLISRIACPDLAPFPG
jgi:hypothetical protein